MKTGADLVMHFLKDMYYAERSILKCLPELAAAAQNASLKSAFSSHAERTKAHLQRLESVFGALGQAVEAVTCEAMIGLLQETDDVIRESGGAGAVRDAALVACAQAVGHYAMARYNTLADWLEMTGRREPASLLRQSLQDEKDMDARLNAIVRTDIGKAMSA